MKRNSNFIGITILHVSSSVSVHHQDILAVKRHWYILRRFNGRLLPGARWNAIPIFSVLQLYMFRAAFLPIIRSS